MTVPTSKDDNPSMWWMITPELRWWKPSMTAILQQKWISNTGKEEWRNVPIIREEE